MNCKDCGGKLIPAEFVFEKRTPVGGYFSQTVQGFKCQECGLRVLTGREAEKVSREWSLAISGSTNRGEFPNATDQTPGPALSGAYDARTPALTLASSP